MAAAIAHEVNNPLEAITNLAYLLTVNPSLDDEARGFARMLLEEVERASRITKQTLAYYRDSAEPVAGELARAAGQRPAAAPAGPDEEESSGCARPMATRMRRRGALPLNCGRCSPTCC